MALEASFQFSGRAYRARLLRSSRAGETDAIVFGLGLTRLDRVWTVVRSGETVSSGTDEAWWSPKGPLTPLARKAIEAIEAS